MTHPVEEMWTPPRQRHPIIRRILLISLALLVALVAVFTIIYQRAAAELDEHVNAEYAASGYVAVFFSATATSTSSYDDIVTLMTSYGMMLDQSACAPYDIYEPQPRGQETFLSGKNPFLTLRTTDLAPPDWETQLRTLPIVESIDTRLLCDGTPIYYQERSWSGWWHGVTNPLYLPLRDPSPIKLRATDSALSYAHAVRLALEMGFRLADPAYEAAIKRGEAPSWHPVSQAEKFASQRTLLVAPTLGTPRNWKSQVEATTSSVLPHRLISKAFDPGLND